MRRSIRTAGGLVLPVLPGIPILIAGLALLGTEHPVRVAITRRLQRWGLMKAPPVPPPGGEAR